MGAIDTKSFRSGNSVAVRFPRDTGLHADVPLTITPKNGGFWVAPKVDPTDGKRRLLAMLEALDALPPVTKFQEREEFEAPERAW